jgi:lipopolysaccharide export system protein LptC
MELATPVFLVPDRQNRYWRISATRGVVPADGSQLQLQGNVLATSPADAPPATRIETEQLNLFPGENRATSAAAVAITRPGLTMNGHGMQADFDRQQISLLSQVRTRYVPQR